MRIPTIAMSHQNELHCGSSGIAERPTTDDYSRSLYREYLTKYRAILMHRARRSETLGRHVGFEEALIDWISVHQESRRQDRTGESGEPLWRDELIRTPVD